MLFGLYGTGGCARSVMPVARAIDPSAGEWVFVDDEPSSDRLNGHRVLTYQEFVMAPGEKQISLAVANSSIRQRLADRCVADGMAFASVVAGNAVVMDPVEIGVGCILSPFVTLTANIRIGKHFHANLYSYVEHDCTIGDFVTFAPGAKCNGNVEIHDHAYIGSGAVLRQGKPGLPLVIGRGAIVGMGAIVTRSVPAGAVVVGNPARPLTRS